ncbi:hypothetical protein EC912_10181 [Luteibacter rhizovicinus]|uniref:DUF5916 domain-containing protein n=1 Tax=Luteibacter rhizovicinus TaxID=242606 RepID=A0A4R3YX35_9GAMM|nr:DUF5916 domain-containing protein [Luteibacter rhizovicinus]TCV97086.1 hypothetical protein EC912_10181 [Luteibacter rhizovicinus]
MFRFAFALALCFLATVANAVEIDGKIDPGEWAGARHITDFRDTQPLTGKPGSMPTEAWVMSTPKGLAIAIRVTQPASMPRTRQKTRRDESALVDRINVMVDFDADGRTGYDFEVTSMGGVADEVITSESNFSYDWDGHWEHAVSEDADGWSVEVLIPWYIAPMRAATGDTRTIGLYIDRVVGTTGERMSWPAASFNRPRFLSDFEHVELPAYSQALLAVTPYVVARADRAHGGTSFQEGADIVWKPNGQTQLTATINPDFGQVESDDLVINFTPEETFFTDKRPFFTENQGIFDFSLLEDYTQLVYTRRVGGAADDSNDAADIAGAMKLNGSVGDMSYGVLAAQEKGDAGRTFGALRLSENFGTQSLGMLATHVSHPYLDRDANVLGIDHRWKPNAKFTITSNIVGSKIDQPNNRSTGFGATTIAEYEMTPVWSQQWLGMHFGDTLQVNDFGYLPRNDFDYAHWEVRQRLTALPDDSAYSSHLWRYRIIGVNNTEGLRLERQFRIIRDSQRRDGGEEFWKINVDSAAYDDLLTRGGNPLHTPPNLTLIYERVRPRIGHWSWKADAEIKGNQLTGLHRVGYMVKFVPTYFFSDELSIFTGASYETTPNWMIWQHDNLVGAFDGRTIGIDMGMNWNIGNRQEVRVKVQALGVGARLRQAYVIDRDGRAVESNEPVKDFGVANLGFQIRYRYEIAPLSNLYIVYNRGGYETEDGVSDANEQFRHSLGLRDTNEALVKVAYRLEF